MGLIKNFTDALLYGTLFYLGLGFMIVVHGFSVPVWAFSELAFVTVFIYLFVQVINVRL